MWCGQDPRRVDVIARLEVPKIEKRVYLATEPLRLRPDPWSPSDYDPRRAPPPLPPASPPKILKLQRKFYKSKSYFGVFKVFTGFNLASSPIIFKLQKVNLTPKRNF